MWALWPPLRGQQVQGETHRIGSRRDISRSVSKVPNHQLSGGIVREVLTAFLDARPGLAERLCSALGSDGKFGDHVTTEELALLRQQVCRVVEAGYPEGGTIVDEPAGLQGHLLHRWASWARDPAAPCAEWLWEGAPAGIT